MAVRALDNASWGFPSSCFVCEPGNPSGLRVPFTVDDGAGEAGEGPGGGGEPVVRAEFSLGPEFSGAPRFVHGGVVLALLDEAMAWAAIALAGRFAVVADTRTRFEHGVAVGRPHRVEARLERVGTRTIDASAEVLDATGRRCARAQARLVTLSDATARQAIGTVEGADTLFLRPSPEVQ